MNAPVTPNQADPIMWRLRLASSPERAFDAWLSPADHVRFWCEQSDYVPLGFRFRFIDGTIEYCTVQRAVRPSHIAYRYFGSLVYVDFERCETGTDLRLNVVGVPSSDWLDVYAGWLNVLLPFKAWVDHGVDLRNHDPLRTWAQRYVDQ
jgi:hypothetical protein